MRDLWNTQGKVWQGSDDDREVLEKIENVGSIGGRRVA